jgi:hypothetical protein
MDRHSAQRRNKRTLGYRGREDAIEYAMLLALLYHFEGNLRQPTHPTNLIGSRSIDMRHQSLEPLGVERLLKIEP